MSGKENFNPNEDFKNLINSNSTTDFDDKTSQQVSILTSNYEKERNDRKEERFIWILVLIIAVDFQFFTSMQNVAGPIIIGLMQLVLIFILAQRCGIDGVLPLIDKVLSVAGNSKNK
jgi:hypothetical protein